MKISDNLKKRALKGSYLSIVLVMLLSKSMAYAQTIKVYGTAFDKELIVSDYQLQLKGSALLRYLVFIEAYVGALYLPKDIRGDQALKDIPRHLVLDYRVGIQAKDFGEATTIKIKESMSKEVYDRLAPKVAQLNRLSPQHHPEQGNCRFVENSLCAGSLFVQCIVYSDYQFLSNLREISFCHSV